MKNPNVKYLNFKAAVNGVNIQGRPVQYLICDNNSGICVCDPKNDVFKRNRVFVTDLKPENSSLMSISL